MLFYSIFFKDAFNVAVNQVESTSEIEKFTCLKKYLKGGGGEPWLLLRGLR